MTAPVNELRNLGPKTAEWLNEVGIHSIEDLRQAGAIGAYRKLKALNPKVSFLALIAMHAALQGRDWREVTADEKEMLKSLLSDQIGNA